jgi:uncharacterized alkaline shock family protein YloU
MRRRKDKEKDRGDQEGKEAVVDPTEASGFAELPESVGKRQDEPGGLGTVKIHDNVVATIARLAALKVPGVLELSGTFVDGLAGMIGKMPVDRGIRVEVKEDGARLDLHVVLEFGVQIPKVAWQVQNEVRQAVETMTGYAVKSVNVFVQTLRHAGEKEPAAEEKER